jgi:hypothetical protein
MTKPVKPQQTSTPAAPAAPVADALDDLLRHYLTDLPEPVDAGFSDRLVARLPAIPLADERRQLALAQYAHWISMSAASCTAATLLMATGGRIEGQYGIAALILFVLLGLWSWPAPWHRT